MVRVRGNQNKGGGRGEDAKGGEDTKTPITLEEYFQGRKKRWAGMCSKHIQSNGYTEGILINYVQEGHMYLNPFLNWLKQPDVPEPEHTFTMTKSTDQKGDVTYKQTPISFKIAVYNKRINIWIKATAALDSTLRSLYNILWGQCSKLMQNKLKASSKFDDKDRDEAVTWLLTESDLLVTNKIPMYHYMTPYIRQSAPNASTRKHQRTLPLHTLRATEQMKMW